MPSGNDAAVRPHWKQFFNQWRTAMSLSRKTALAVTLISGLAAGSVVGIVGAAYADRPSITAGAGNLDETYPNMRRALRDLHHARDSLVAAEDIFKGRREEAIKRTDEAIHQVDVALSEH
jgi:hypothetical protein